ncbi:MAG TPA: methyltransferase domain-containing protein, partial [Burkholderiales bacterium]|nr:methyltransferase domain-containing protein [Burkholderiales bacterium]
VAELDARAARRRFDRAAATYGKAAYLEREVGRRMLERLDVVRLAPARILDAGAGPAPQAAALARRFPGARLVALDFSLPMLARARAAAGWLASLRGRAPLALCGALERVPLAPGSVQLVWSNMALHWAADGRAALAELARVLEPGGLLMFSTLGPDTLKEVREALGEAHVHRFADMHDLGDELGAAGFAAPVMDMEMITLTYREPLGLAADLRASGQTLARRDRARGLAPRALRKALEAAGVSVSIEVVYGHAWKGVPRTASDGRSIVHFERRTLPAAAKLC